MSYGYSANIIALNKKADATKLGVRIGRVCIRKDIPVKDAADKFGVSRQTLYNWFSGATNPPISSVERLSAVLASLRQ